MTSPDFDTLFDAAALEFDAAFRRSSRARRPDEIGGPREEHLREFLAEWLPSKYGVTHGYVLSLQKEVSRQCDVILYEADRTLRLVQDKGTGRRLVPLADTFGTMEAKSVLSLKELDDSVAKLKQFRGMSDGGTVFVSDLFDEVDVKAAEIEPSQPHRYSAPRRVVRDDDFQDYRVKVPRRNLKRTPPFTILFAYKMGSDLTLDKLKARLEQEQAIDAAFVLDTGFVVRFSEATAKRLKSLRDGVPTRDLRFDAEIFGEVIRNMEYRRTKSRSYIGQQRDAKLTLLLFYAYLLDELQLQQLAEHSPIDLLAVWSGGGTP